MKIQQRLGPPLKRVTGVLERVNTWIPSIAVVIGGIWALYQFYLTEDVHPRAVRPHITLEVSSATAGSRGSLTAIESTFHVENRSPKRVYIIAGAFTLEGRTIVPTARKPDEFLLEANKRYFGREIDFASSLAVGFDRWTTVAAGQIFSRWQLGPNESATRRVTSYVAAGGYDAVELRAKIAIVDSLRGANADGMVRVNADGGVSDIGDPMITVYSEGDSGERKKIPLDTDSDLLDAVHFEVVEGDMRESLWDESSIPSTESTKHKRSGRCGKERSTSGDKDRQKDAP